MELDGGIEVLAVRAIAPGLTYPRMCSPSSIITSSTLATPTVTPRQATHSVRRATHRARPGRHGDHRLQPRHLLFTTDSEAVRRIHHVCCRLDDIAGAAALMGSRRPWCVSFAD